MFYLGICSGFSPTEKCNEPEKGWQIADPFVDLIYGRILEYRRSDRKYTHLVTFFLMLVLLEHPASTWEKQGLLCKDYSTYLYLAHPLFIAILSAGQDMIGIQQPAALYVLEVLAFTLFSRVVLQWCRQFRVRRRGTNEK